MDPLLQTTVTAVVTAICSVLACSGFWNWMQKRSDKKDAKTDLLIGLAHDRIIQSGSFYIERGYITHDEYENLYDYLYKPYKELGGNGTAEHMIKQLQKLEMRKGIIIKEGED